MNATYPASEHGARKFFHAAIAGVASMSIRKWALSEHNAPIWEREALAWLQAGRTDTTKFTTLIVVEAMGM